MEWKMTHFFPNILFTYYKSRKEKGQTTIYKTLHRKLKIDQHEPHWKRGVPYLLTSWNHLVGDLPHAISRSS